MAGCDKYNELMSAAIDGEITPDEEKELFAHLKACPECSSLFDSLTVLSNEFSDMLVNPPDTLAPAIMAEIAKANHRRHKTRFFSAFGRFAAAAAVIVFVLFIANTYMTTMEENKSTAADESVSMKESEGLRENESYAVSMEQADHAPTEEPVTAGDSDAGQSLTDDPEASLNAGALGSGSENGGTGSIPGESEENDSGSGIMVQPSVAPNSIEASPPTLVAPFASNMQARSIWEKDLYNDSTYYCVAILSGTAIPEQVESCELVLQNDNELHYKVPAETIEELNEDGLFTEIYYDNTEAGYGIIVIYVPIS